ncbi:MAG: hypothetical protein PWP23_2277 [Candidatus Sumerlaeota bacterium]|nr:hypothetical protein [Candidatus Sumerlaeota bacterium]
MTSAPMNPFHATRKVVVAVIGGTVVLLGIALLVLPGPAFIVIPLGLAILATEFVWARRWLGRARDTLHDVARKPTRRRQQWGIVRWWRRMKRDRNFITIGRGL